MADEPKTSPRIKVVDRRWFTDSGEPRADEPSRAAPHQMEPAEEALPEAEAELSSAHGDRGAGGDPPSVDDRGESEGRPDHRGRSEGLPEVSFLHLTNFLAQQAALLLQGTEGLPKDSEQARVFIDFLALLETKTSGNLTSEEARFLSEMLFQLRTMFIQATA